jgi:hypothetical protein
MSIERGLGQRFNPEGGKKLRSRKVFFKNLFALLILERCEKIGK